jgi:hypothetical protein
MGDGGLMVGVLFSDVGIKGKIIAFSLYEFPRLEIGIPVS